MSGPPIDVVKLGGSVLTGPRRLPAIAEALARHRRGRRLAVVVSALRGSTDNLQSLADRLCPDHRPEACAALLATGELHAAAAMTLALCGVGEDALLLDPERVGPWTSGPPLDAEPRSVSVSAVRRALEQAPVVVLPGFVGRDPGGWTTLLGRGGSDLSAVFLAHALGARCFLIKDTEGICTRDPAVGPAAGYATLTWEDAAGVAGVCVQPKALRFAWSRGQPFFVGCLERPAATRVGDAPTRLRDIRTPVSARPTGG